MRQGVPRARAHAKTWTNFVTVSDSKTLNQGRLCQAGDDSSELGCPTYDLQSAASRFSKFASFEK